MIQLLVMVSRPKPVASKLPIKKVMAERNTCISHLLQYEHAPSFIQPWMGKKLIPSLILHPSYWKKWPFPPPA